MSGREEMAEQPIVSTEDISPCPEGNGDAGLKVEVKCKAPLGVSPRNKHSTFTEIRRKVSRIRQPVKVSTDIRGVLMVVCIQQIQSIHQIQYTL